MEKTGSTPPNSGVVDYALEATIGGMSRDMKILGIFIIIYGALTSLSIIGALIGIPLIFSGLRLRESADFFEVYRHDGNQSTLNQALTKQARTFNILKILIIISLVLTALYIVFIILFMGTMMSQMNNLNF